MRAVSRLGLILGCLFFCILTGCGGDSVKSDTSRPTGSDLIVSPSQVQLNPGATQHFEVQESSGAAASVTWHLSGSCVDEACGTVSDVGLYTAPPTSPGTVTLTATLINDSSKSGSAYIQVTKPLGGLQIAPTTATVAAGTTQLFQISGCLEFFGCKVQLSGEGCSGDSCGSFESFIAGELIYRAPSVVPDPPMVTLTATSFLVKRTATITITGNPTAFLSGSTLSTLRGENDGASNR
jgi:hypothetical protein